MNSCIRKKGCGTVGWSKIGLGRVMTETTHLRQKQPNPCIRLQIHKQNYPGPKRILTFFQSDTRPIFIQNYSLFVNEWDRLKMSEMIIEGQDLGW